MSTNVFRNVCRDLQISPKHFKISQYESCPGCRGTQLSCKLAFQILSGNWWKTWSTDSSSYSPKCGDIQSLAVICAKSVEKKHHTAFVKVVEGSEIYNFSIHHFVHFYSNFWSFKHSNRGAVTQFRASRAAPASPSGPPTPPEAPCFPTHAHTPRRLEGSPATCHAPPRRSAAPPVPAGPPRASLPRARRPMPLAVPRLKAGYSFERWCCHSPVFPRGIKRPTRPSRTWAPPGLAPACLLLCASEPPASKLAPSRCPQPCDLPSPPLALPGAGGAVSFLAPAGRTPKIGVQRLVPVSAAKPPRLSRPAPFFGLKSIPAELTHLLHP
jgi:hypothetical protein